jgi:hypothetical protein
MLNYFFFFLLSLSNVAAFFRITERNSELIVEFGDKTFVLQLLKLEQTFL